MIFVNLCVHSSIITKRSDINIHINKTKVILGIRRYEFNVPISQSSIPYNQTSDFTLK